MRVARRRWYLRQFFRAGPHHLGTERGCTFVIINHCYDLDIDALCAADTPHTLWVVNPFALFTDVHHYFAPDQIDLHAVYGVGAMAASIARYKAAYITDLARELRDRTHLDALITPTDVAYYIRPLIEELRAIGIPTIVQDKEGTISPGAIMDDHAQVLSERYPPISDQYYFWSEAHRDFWLRVGVPEERAFVLGQPRSDFFFHPDRWPSKASLGLAEDKKVILAFTYDADAYMRSTEPNPDRPWKTMRDDTHAALRELARARADVEVVIKTHPQQADLDEILAEHSADPLPNVKLVMGASQANHFMVRADVIVGFQSTAMIEAMMTKTPVIYAGWGAVHDRASDTLIPIHRSGGCTVPRSLDDFRRLLASGLDGGLRLSPAMLRARKAFTDSYFFDADGKAARRVLDHAAAFVTGKSPRRVASSRAAG